MSRMVHCVVLNREAEGFDAPPYPGEIGMRVYENVSLEGWQRWQERLAMIINEYGMNTADPRSIGEVEEHMLGFFFKEGSKGDAPSGFAPAK